MILSLDFWLELLTIALIFGLVIYFMPRIRNYTLHKNQAVNLRVRISERINASLPAIAATVVSSDINSQLTSQRNDLGFTLQRLKALMTESSVLYSDERERVERFIDAMTKVNSDVAYGITRQEETEDLLLMGQRILLDLKENGLLSVQAWPFKAYNSNTERQMEGVEKPFSRPLQNLTLHTSFWV